MKRSYRLLCSMLLLTATTSLASWSVYPKHNNAFRFKFYEWNQINSTNEQWAARAGLQVLNLNNRLYLMGGRTPIDPAILPIPGASMIWGDVWESDDRGKTWNQILATDDFNHWPARAYFEGVTKGKHMYVLGGQNFFAFENPGTNGPPFISGSEFFNDVWRSRDGVNWKQMTADAGWEPRAGLSAVTFRNEIYVMGGSQNDDDSIVGPGGPVRIYFNDVWKSKDGKNWKQVTANAPWSPRAGARVVVKNGYMYLIGGEVGFVGFPPPYFNDVWRSRNGRDWELVTANAPWSSRPGHMCVVLQDHIVLFGGFGLGFDLSVPANPMDVWISRNGKNWVQVDDMPWNATSPADVKYDFDALAIGNKIYTFGGDRETFDFSDPFNYLNVDNDVWTYAPKVRKFPWWLKRYRYRYDDWD